MLNFSISCQSVAKSSTLMNFPFGIGASSFGIGVSSFGIDVRSFRLEWRSLRRMDECRS